MNAKQLCAIFFVVVFSSGVSLCPAGPAYPLKQSANRRYLVDQNNAPVLMLGDAPQSLFANLTTNETAAYLADRSGFGYNTLWVNLLCATYTAGIPSAADAEGVVPFTAAFALTPGADTTNYDLTKPNEAYFARVDRMLNLAGQQGIQILLDPCETGSFLTVMRANGTNRCRTYGQYLGNRYKNFTNIIWMSGNDFQSWRNSDDDAVVRAVAQGIKDNDTNHLQTTELDYTLSSSLNDTNWNSILGLNGTYTYFPTYAQLELDYNRTNFLPNFLVEANYEFEALAGPETFAPELRKQEWWTFTSGGCGHIYGNHFTWTFAGGWQDNLDTPGATQIGYLKAFLEPRAWYNLIPDTNHTVVTTGFGTFSTTDQVASNDYLTAARTADGSLVVIYTPIIRQFTVDMSQLAGPAAAHWFDPAGGTYLPIGGSPLTNSGSVNFTPPGNNNDGDGGWVLVLETNPPAIPPPPPPPPPKPKFIQQNFATPQTPQSSVGAAYPATQVAGNANILAIGWNDATNNIASVSDTTGNTYHIALPTFRGNGMSQAIYYATNIAAGANTVTVTFDHPAVYVDLRITEYSGLSPTNVFDAGSSDVGIGTGADSGSVSIAATNELLFAAGMTATTFTSPGLGFTQRVITTPDSDIVEDQVAALPISYNGTAGLTSGAWLMQLAAFRGAPATINAPTLRIFLTANNTAVIAWPASSDAGFHLQQSPALNPAGWINVTNAVGTNGNESQAIITMPAGNVFYRLINP
jgi:hypothetical protein